MIKPEDLLLHASRNAPLPLFAVPEVDLRRAVSAAYYALFHTLAQSGARLFEAAGPSTTAQVVRAFDHGTMVRVCKDYLHKEVRAMADPRLVRVAEAFVDLQDARERADYALLETIDPLKTHVLVSNCEIVVRFWADIDGTQPGYEFLTKLLLGTRLRRG